MKTPKDWLVKLNGLDVGRVTDLKIEDFAGLNTGVTPMLGGASPIIGAIVDLALSVLAEACGTSRSGVVEDLVRAALVRAKPARRSRIVGASDNWIAIYDNGARRAEPARRYANDRPFNHEELSGDSVYAYGPSKADAEMRLDAELATRRPRRETK